MKLANSSITKFLRKTNWLSTSSKLLLAIGVLVVGLNGTAQAQTYQWASSSVQDVTKNGSSNFGTAELVDLLAIGPAAVGQYVNYTTINIDLTSSTSTWAADGNEGMYLNSGMYGFSFPGDGYGAQWITGGTEGSEATTLSYNYSNDILMKAIFAAAAAGSDSYSQLGIASDWPVWNGSDEFTISKVYLSNPVATPEPTTFGLLGIGAAALVFIRRRK